MSNEESVESDGAIVDLAIGVELLGGGELDVGLEVLERSCGGEDIVSMTERKTAERLRDPQVGETMSALVRLLYSSRVGYVGLVVPCIHARHQRLAQNTLNENYADEL